VEVGIGTDHGLPRTATVQAGIGEGAGILVVAVSGIRRGRMAAAAGGQAEVEGAAVPVITVEEGRPGADPEVVAGIVQGALVVIVAGLSHRGLELAGSPGGTYADRALVVVVAVLARGASGADGKGVFPGPKGIGRLLKRGTAGRLQNDDKQGSQAH